MNEGINEDVNEDITIKHRKNHHSSSAASGEFIIMKGSHIGINK